jgi:UDP-2,4-diacetamido-2,4,6-trideoxy-beta-L-altropyranose hydrolase
MLDNAATVFVRVDANRQMGIGHAMRCLAVCEQLIARGCRVTFAMQQVPSALIARLEKASIALLHLNKKQSDAASFRQICTQASADLVMIDGYHLGNCFEQSFAGSGIRSLRFDDFLHGEGCTADVVVNASAHADHISYQDWAPGAALLLGPAHLAYRSDMISAYQALEARKMATENPNQLNGNACILINFGGSDHLDMTLRTASAIAAMLPDAKIEAVTGAAYPNPERLNNLGIEKLTHHHNTNNLAEVIQRARMAISAGGLTVAELALFRIPTILAITAQNQVKGAHVSWCHTIVPKDGNGQIDTADMLDKILVETKRLWCSPSERKLITDRIPADLDIAGADRIATALMKHAPAKRTC